MRGITLVTQAIIIALCLPFTYGGCGGGGGGSSSDGQVWVEESFFSEIIVDTHNRFLIQAVAGSIDIIGSPTANSVTIEGERRVGSKTRADAEAHLNLLQVEVTDHGIEVLVETIQPQLAHGRNYEVDYRITIPDNLEVYATQFAGPVFIDTINSPVSVSTFAGDVDLVEVSGSTQVNVINGHIIGQITLPLDGTIDMTVFNGDINLDIPQNMSATFSASLIRGFIQLFNLVLQNEVRTSHSVTGTLGDGQGDIWLETETGNITVSGF